MWMLLSHVPSILKRLERGKRYSEIYLRSILIGLTNGGNQEIEICMNHAGKRFAFL